MIPKDLLDILACPVCKKPVELRDDGLVCGSCRKAYPIRDGIPIMLIEESVDAPAPKSSLS
jgi:uncharacterized protein YbaR (Trm112 family)